MEVMQKSLMKVEKDLGGGVGKEATRVERKTVQLAATVVVH